MSSRILSNEIAKKIYSDENLEDIIVMIDSLAYERAFSRRREETVVDYIFSGGVICVFFEPLKLPDFIQQSTDFRRSYKGISENKEFQENFRESFTPELIGVETIKEAIDLGFDVLFKNEGFHREFLS